jgi:hypothetical protein
MSLRAQPGCYGGSGQAFPLISWTGQPDSNIARVKVWGLVIDPRASRDWGAHNGAGFPSRPLKMSQDPTFRRRRPAWSLRAAQGLSGGIFLVTRMQQRNIAQRCRQGYILSRIPWEQITPPAIPCPDAGHSQLPAFSGPQHGACTTHRSASYTMDARSSQVSF